MSEANILTKVQFQFSGLSHIQEATEGNPVHNLYLLTDENRATKQPKVNARVKDAAQFLGILSGFFAMLGKGLIYQPSSEHPRLSQIASLLASRRSMRPIHFYSRLYAFMEDELEPKKAAMDPVLTVRDGVCYLCFLTKVSIEISYCACLRVYGKKEGLLKTELPPSI